jgi:hypothetical protein
MNISAKKVITPDNRKSWDSSNLSGSAYTKKVLSSTGAFYLGQERHKAHFSQANKRHPNFLPVSISN